ncbi:cell wall protein DAN4-like [Alosa alosa]|nr:cell wall protein DAN4-like [Alosa alosa]
MLVNSTKFEDAIEGCLNFTENSTACPMSTSSPGTTTATPTTRNTSTTSPASPSTTTTSTTSGTTTATPTTRNTSTTSPTSPNTTATSTTSTASPEKETSITSSVHSSVHSSTFSGESLSVLGFLMVSVILNIVLVGLLLKQRHSYRQINTQPYRYCTCEGDNTIRLNAVSSGGGSVI